MSHGHKPNGTGKTTYREMPDLVWELKEFTGSSVSARWCYDKNVYKM